MYKSKCQCLCMGLCVLLDKLLSDELDSIGMNEAGWIVILSKYVSCKCVI